VQLFLANGLAELCFIHCFESNSYRPAAAMQTPPSKSGKFDASTPPEVGLLEPLSASTIESWLSHAWYDESHEAITRGIDQAFELQDELKKKEGCDLNVVRRLDCLIDYLLDCCERLTLPDFPRQS
jgi:hypothetical protein